MAVAASAASGDEAVILVGLSILSVAITIYRVNKFMANDIDIVGEVMMNEWVAKWLTFGGGLAAAASPFQVIGAVCSIVGVVFLFLNYRINCKRLEMQLQEAKGKEE